MDRPLCETVLCTLYPEWENPRCCVPVPCALTGDCILRSVKSSPQEGEKRMRDASKKRCVACIMNDKGKILEESTYDNTLADVFADYNRERIHSAIGYMMPVEFASQWEMKNK